MNSYGGETDYHEIQEPTFNCKDMDARLRGILLQHLGKPVTYSFSWKAKEAFVRRAKEVTPGTIEMLLKAIPESFPIIDKCWHVFPEDIVHRLVIDSYWDSDKCYGQIPSFMQDHILRHGESLLEKYESSNMILTNILAREEDDCFETPGAGERENKSPMTSPETYVKYFKRYRNMPKKWKDSSRYDDKILQNIGRLVLDKKLDIDLHVKKEVKANES